MEAKEYRSFSPQEQFQLPIKAFKDEEYLEHPTHFIHKRQVGD